MSRGAEGNIYIYILRIYSAVLLLQKQLPARTRLLLLLLLLQDTIDWKVRCVVFYCPSDVDTVVNLVMPPSLPPPARRRPPLQKLKWHPKGQNRINKLGGTPKESEHKYIYIYIAPLPSPAGNVTNPCEQRIVAPENQLSTHVRVDEEELVDRLHSVDHGTQRALSGQLQLNLRKIVRA